MGSINFLRFVRIERLQSLICYFQGFSGEKTTYNEVASQKSSTRWRTLELTEIYHSQKHNIEDIHLSTVACDAILYNFRISYGFFP